jgi:hypothetical protein
MLLTAARPLESHGPNALSLYQLDQHPVMPMMWWY